MKNDKNWWRVTLHNGVGEGFVPKTHLATMNGVSCDEAIVPTVNIPATNDSGVEGTGLATGSMSRTGSGPSEPLLVRVIQSFQASNSKELTVDRGDIVRVCDSY